MSAWGNSEKKRIELEKREFEDRMARYAAIAKKIEDETEERKALYEKLEREIEKIKSLRLKMRPPTLNEGDLRVLREMAGDLTAKEWTQRIHAPLLEIERACAWLGVAPRRGV